MSLFASRRSSFTTSHYTIVSLGALALLVLAACDNRSAARCTPGCSSVQMCCASSSSGNRCVDHFSDPANCGACGNVCASGQLCVNRMCMSTMTLPDAGPVDAPFVGRDAPVTGSCSPSCGADFQCCGTTCVNRDGAGGTSDPSFGNCGACGRACDSDEANHCGRFGTMTQCMCGSGPKCDSALGESCVLGMSGDYECLRSDIPTNCGSPPVRCNDGEACEAGECVCGTLGRRCADGETCTVTGGTSSCRDLSSDPMNCGMVGRVCGAGEECSGGSCLCPGAGGSMTACMAAGGGMIPIGGGPASCGDSGGFTLPCGSFASCGEVCCPGMGCVAVDNSNCGGCGVACTGDQECGSSLGGGGDGGLPFP